MWNVEYSARDGLNITEMGLNFNDSYVEYGNYVASYVALGDNAILDSIQYAIDGDLSKYTTLGNTAGQTERLRLTLGFLSSSRTASSEPGEIIPPSESEDPSSPALVPEPASIVLLGLGLLVFSSRERKKQVKPSK